MEGARRRSERTCIRCGRVGKNAYRRVDFGPGLAGWVCTHGETCVERMRSRGRRLDRGVEADGPPVAFVERPICVIGSDTDATTTVEHVLAEFAGADVDRLDHTPRSLARLTRRDYSLVVVDAGAEDPVSYLSDLARRLEKLRARGVAIVVAHTPDAIGPAVERLMSDTAAHPLARPFDVSALLDTVARALADRRPMASAGGLDAGVRAPISAPLAEA